MMNAARAAQRGRALKRMRQAMFPLRGALALGAVLLLANTGYAGRAQAAEPQQLQIWFIDVEGGQATLFVRQRDAPAGVLRLVPRR